MEDILKDGNRFVAGETFSLEPKYKDHALIGDYKDFRECHVKANLLLIYRHFGDELLLARIGSHQALFKKY